MASCALLYYATEMPSAGDGTPGPALAAPTPPTVRMTRPESQGAGAETEVVRTTQPRRLAGDFKDDDVGAETEGAHRVVEVDADDEPALRVFRLDPGALIFSALDPRSMARLACCSKEWLLAVNDKANKLRHARINCHACTHPLARIHAVPKSSHCVPRWRLHLVISHEHTQSTKPTSSKEVPPRSELHQARMFVGAWALMHARTHFQTLHTSLHCVTARTLTSDSWFMGTCSHKQYHKQCDKHNVPN